MISTFTKTQQYILLFTLISQSKHTFMQTISLEFDYANDYEITFFYNQN